MRSNATLRSVSTTGAVARFHTPNFLLKQGSRKLLALGKVPGVYRFATGETLLAEVKLIFPVRFTVPFVLNSIF
ncbi:hypothetical protein D3C85_1787860 [compost metagenome]